MEKAQVKGILIIAGVFLLGVAFWHLASTRPGAGTAPVEAVNYDISQFLRVDPSLIIFREAVKFRPGFKAPACVAVDASDNVYVGGRGVVEVFDKTGKPLGSKTTSQSQITCLAIARDGTLFAGISNGVEQISQSGDRKWIDIHPKAMPTSLSVSDNDLYVADCANRVVWHLKRDGSPAGRIGDPDAQRKEGCVIPSPYFDVALENDGSVWLANTGMHRLEHFNADGKLLGMWGRFGMGIDGFCGCCNPSHFAIMPDGGIVTSEKGLPRVKLYSKDGAFVGVVAAPADFDEGTAGLDLAVDSLGRVIVLDPKRGLVRIFVRGEESVSAL